MVGGLAGGVSRFAPGLGESLRGIREHRVVERRRQVLGRLPLVGVAVVEAPAALTASQRATDALERVGEPRSG